MIQFVHFQISIAQHIQRLIGVTAVGVFIHQVFKGQGFVDRAALQAFNDRLLINGVFKPVVFFIYGFVVIGQGIAVLVVFKMAVASTQGCIAQYHRPNLIASNPVAVAFDAIDTSFKINQGRFIVFIFFLQIVVSLHIITHHQAAFFGQIVKTLCLIEKRADMRFAHFELSGFVCNITDPERAKCCGPFIDWIFQRFIEVAACFVFLIVLKQLQASVKGHQLIGFIQPRGAIFHCFQGRKRAIIIAGIQKHLTHEGLGIFIIL